MLLGLREMLLTSPERDVIIFLVVLLNAMYVVKDGFFLGQEFHFHCHQACVLTMEIRLVRHVCVAVLRGFFFASRSISLCIC